MENKVGIIMAGNIGTRLKPLTDVINKYLKKKKSLDYKYKSIDNWYDLVKIDELIDFTNFLNIYQKNKKLEIS